MTQIRIEKGDPEATVRFAYSPQALKDFKKVCPERTWVADSKSWLIPAKGVYTAAVWLKELGHQVTVVDTPVSRLAALESRVEDLEGALDGALRMLNNLLGLIDPDEEFSIDDVIEVLPQGWDL
jgi:hypothetical protein